MIEIIPAIDIIDGSCVRLTQGDYDRKTTYGQDVVSVARSYEKLGVRRLHMVDLDGAKESFPRNLDTLREVAASTSLDIQYGGGIKSREALISVFEAGASRAICGSVAVSSPELFRQWFAEFGPQRIILGADIREGRVATHGWLEQSTLSIDQLIDTFVGDGLAQVICTDISKDGMLRGPSFELYERLQSKYNVVNVTISGGVSSMSDIEKLDAMGLRSVIIGKAIYEGRITQRQISEFINRCEP